MLELAKQTNQQVKMGPGTLYETSKGMLESGFVEECESVSIPTSATNAIGTTGLPMTAVAQQWSKPNVFGLLYV
jgi:hypothetical protein